MKVRRLIGGLVVAVVIAYAMSQRVEAVYINCGWMNCWPF